MISRRIFMGGLLAAPAVVQASSLMPLWVPREVFYFDGLRNDSPAWAAWQAGKPVRRLDGRPVTRQILGEWSYIADPNVCLGRREGGPPLEVMGCHFWTTPTTRDDAKARAIGEMARIQLAMQLR